jgi:hypothetical protein
MLLIGALYIFTTYAADVAFGPGSYMGPGVAGWMVLGVIYLIYLYARNPQRLVEVGLVHLEEP